MYKKSIYKKLANIQNPFSIEKFIEISLYDEEGYYTNSNIIGSDGDFVTSPEISQLFGEIIGLYIKGIHDDINNASITFISG